MNELPLSLFIANEVLTFGLIIFTFIYRENLLRTITAFLSMILAYVNSMVLINGNVVLIQTTGTAYSYITISNAPLSYFYLFIAILMGLFTILFIADEVNMYLSSELPGDG